MTEFAILMAVFGLVLSLMLKLMFVEKGGHLEIRDPKQYPVSVLGVGEVPNPIYGFKAQYDRIENFLALPVP